MFIHMLQFAYIHKIIIVLKLPTLTIQSMDEQTHVKHTHIYTHTKRIKKTDVVGVKYHQIFINQCCMHRKLLKYLKFFYSLFLYPECVLWCMIFYPPLNKTIFKLKSFAYMCKK